MRMRVVEQNKMKTKKKFENKGETDSVKKKMVTEENENGYFNDSPSEKWYNEIKYSSTLESKSMTYEDIDKLRNQASVIFNEAVILNSSKPPKSISNSDYIWIKTVMSKGTKTDKIAAYTLLIQDSPLHNLSLLKNMVDMVKVGKKKECFMAIDTLSELFLNDLLPPNRKLLSFSQQPLSRLDEMTSGNITARKRRLLLWYFEEQLKSIYGDFVNYLNKIAHDTIEANKEKVITVMCKLLEGNPERESMLLNNIVNKLGDPSHKVGSKVIYALTKLLQTHPNMREVVIDAVEKVIFRTHISKRAQYYSVCFLSQFFLFNGDGKLAKKLISIYLSLFKACIKMGDVDSRMMSALLTGVNRAYPYAKEELGMLKDHIDTIFKVIHLSHANVAIQALSLVYLICSYSSSYTDRFYCALYKKIGEIEMFQSSHHAMFLSLIYKTLKNDKEDARKFSFVKRLFQICGYVPVPVACGILIMLSELMKGNKKIFIRETLPENNMTAKYEEDNSDDGDEHYDDVKEDQDAITDISKDSMKEVMETSNNDKEKIYNVKPTANLKVWTNPDKSVEVKENVNIHSYDPFVRNPLYAGANKVLCSELYKLSQHYHPTLSLFANKIINGEPIIYSGDPLLDFTLIRFLDKFSFKNPKEIKPEEEKNITFSKFGRKKYYSSETVRRLRANTADYLNHSEKNIPADEVFLYRYMKEKLQKTPVTKKDDSDVESVGSDEFEEMLSGLADGKKDDVDFLSEVGQLPKKIKAKKGKKNEIEDDDDTENEDGGNDEEDGDDDNDDDDDDNDDEEEDGDFEDGEDALIEELDGDEEFRSDDEEMQGSEVDEAELEEAFGNFKLPDFSKLQKKKMIKKKHKGNYKDNLFASAEEFSELLEEADYNAGGSEALSNKDRSAVKQLKWESDRDKWIHKKNYRSKGIRRTNFKKGLKLKKELKKAKKRF